MKLMPPNVQENHRNYPVGPDGTQSIQTARTFRAMKVIPKGEAINGFDVFDFYIGDKRNELHKVDFYLDDHLELRFYSNPGDPTSLMATESLDSPWSILKYFQWGQGDSDMYFVAIVVDDTSRTQLDHVNVGELRGGVVGHVGAWDDAP